MLLLILNAIIFLTNITIMSYFIVVITSTSIADMFMSKANRFELQIKDFWN